MQEIIKEVTKEADRVAKKQKTSSAKATATLTALITEIQTARAQVGSTDDPGRRAEAFKDFQTRVAQKLADVTETQAAGRELNAVVARLGKASGASETRAAHGLSRRSPVLFLSRRAHLCMTRSALVHVWRRVSTDHSGRRLSAHGSTNQ